MKDWQKYRQEFRQGHDAWRPKKRLTREQMSHLRTLRQEQPDLWTSAKLAESFGISFSSVVRILRSKFEPSPSVIQRQDAAAMRRKAERQHKTDKGSKHKTKKHRVPVDNTY